MAKTRTKTAKKPAKAALSAPKSVQVVTLRARYDAAQTTDENRRHWTNADAFSADAVANPMVRRTLRNRARYEVANDCYAKGIVSTVANDTVGPGPKLQILGMSKKRAQNLEAMWNEYAAAIRWAEKLRVMRAARMVSGEVFAIHFTNPSLRSVAKLDVRIVEPDHVAGVAAHGTEAGYYDGISYDAYANPISYDVLTAHPGDTGTFLAVPGDADEIPAAYVFHYYKMERPGQRRGVPEVTPSLPLFAYRRRYGLATIASAETAANHAGVMHTDSPADADNASTVAPYDLVELERNGAVVLPAGWKLEQLDPSQPTTSYVAFTNAIIGEMARCVDMPFTIAALDSSESNMSAAYMDQSAYAKARKIDRQELDEANNWQFRAWWQEMFLMGEVGNPNPPARQWYWPQLGEHADPAKVANAQAVRLKNGTTSLAREFATMGLDHDTEIQSAAENFGVTVDDYKALLRASVFANGNLLPDRETPGQPPATPTPTE
jgi:capsid protein